MKGRREAELRSAQLFLTNFVGAFRRVNDHWANAVDLPDDDQAQDELLAAGQAACDALTQLLNDNRLHWVLVAPQRQQAPAITQVSTALENPDLERLLVALGYRPRQDARELLEIVRRSLQELPDNPRAVDVLVAEAREAIGELQEVICELSKSRRGGRKLRRLVGNGRKVLGAILLGLILNPEVQHVLADLAGDHPLPAMAASSSLPLAVGLAVIKMINGGDARFPAPTVRGSNGLEAPGTLDKKRAGPRPTRRHPSLGRAAGQPPRQGRQGTKKSPPGGRQRRPGASPPGR